MPTECFPRSMVAPSMLAHVMVDKFCDGLPLQVLVIGDANIHNLLLERSDREGGVGQVPSDGIRMPVFIGRVPAKIRMSQCFDQPRGSGSPICNSDHRVGGTLRIDVLVDVARA